MATTQHAPRRAAAAAARRCCGRRAAARCSASAPPPPGRGWGGEPGRAASALAASLLLLAPLPPPPAGALDTARVGVCLFESCVAELSRCLADEKCAESVVCLNRCNGAPDESDCQIKCGNLYADQAVRDFNACAVSRAKCVPQRADAGAYPVPNPESLVPALDVAELTGRWWISAGLNPLFDTFDCQQHFFAATGPGSIAAKINWRVQRPNGQFYERSDLQRFVQDPNLPAALYNHGNEVLHYQDDWYVGAYQKDAYFLVYYRGRNDAWDGYGGAVVYTREPTLREEYVPALSGAAQRLGLDWSKFQRTDNSCPPQPAVPSVVAPGDLDTLADDVRALGAEAEADLESALVSFGRGVTLLRGDPGAAAGAVARFAGDEERALEGELGRAKRALDEIEMKVAMSDFWARPANALARLLGLAQQQAT